MGWSAQYFTTIIIEGNTPQTGIFIYSGAPGTGNLIGSWAAAAGQDAFGNSYPSGINVFQGQLTGVSINSSTINAGAILGAALTNCSFTSGTLTNDQISQSTFIMNSSGGVILGYSTTTTTSTFNSPGSPTFTSPVSGTASVSCWGSGAGAGGGGAFGGETGGGGEWANEPAYTLLESSVYAMVIPAGGTGGQSGTDGNSGSQCQFDTGLISGPSVVANGGVAGPGNYVAGTGGTGSTNTNHFNGGNGATGGVFSGGCSGGNSGCPTAAGNNGVAATGSGGANAPAAQTSAGRGGAGGANGANGSNGATPGGAGGGAGAGSSSNAFNETYTCSATYAYNGTDVSGPTYLENTNGNMLQGNPDVGEGNYPGNQYSFAYFSNHAAIESALSGVTITQVKVTVDNLHSWYGSGMYVCLGYSNRTSFPNSNIGAGGNANQTAYWIDQGHALTQDVTSAGIGQAFQNGTATCLTFGPATPSNSDPSLYDYGYFKGGSGNAIMQIIGTTGSGVNQSGNGGNGTCMVTYSSTTTLTAAMSAVSGTDSAGNAYGAGFTGQIAAFEPGSNPSVVETWHTLTLASGWTAVNGPYYRYTEDNCVEMFGSATHAAFTGTTLLTAAGALPTGYRPTSTWNVGGTGIPGRAGAEVSPAGTVSAVPNGTSCTECDIAGKYPLGL
jgi:hypothetical protein